MDQKDSGRPTADDAVSKSEADKRRPRDVHGSATGLRGKDKGLTPYYAYRMEM